MARHQTRREVDLPLPIEQSGSEGPDIGGQIVEEVAAVAGDAGWRHIQIAGEIESHRAVQDAAQAPAWRSESVMPIRFII
jgi:hypothetical protein